MARRPWRAATVGVLLLAAPLSAAASTSARDAWSQPAALSEAPASCLPAKCQTFPELATSASGDAVAVWRSYYGFRQSRPSGYDCRLSVRRRGGAWSAPEPAPGGSCPSVAVGAGGVVVAVWATSDGVLAQTRSAAGAWLRGQRLARTTHAASPVVAASAAGAVAAWTDGDSIVVATAGRTGRFGAPVRIASGADLTTELRAALDAPGDALVGWSPPAGAGASAAFVFRPAGGRWQAVQRLVRGRGSIGTPDLGLDARGRAVAGWSTYSPETGTQVWVASASEGGRFGRPVRLAAHGDVPAVALGSGGDAVAAWEAGGRIVAAIRSASGVWGVPRPISAPDTRVGRVALAVSPAGEAVAAWIRYGFEAGARADVLQAAVRRPGGRFGAAANVSRPGQLGGSPSVGVDAGGTGVLLWEDADSVVTTSDYTP